MACSGMTTKTEEAVKSLIETVRTEEMPSRERVIQALKDIINWNPEVPPIQFQLEHSVYAGMTRSKKQNAEYQKELDGDVQCQFVSESYLYNLLGKDDARSLLSRFRSLAVALHIEDIRELYENCPGCGRAPHHTGVRCADPEDDKNRVNATTSRVLRERPLR